MDLPLFNALVLLTLARFQPLCSSPIFRPLSANGEMLSGKTKTCFAHQFETSWDAMKQTGAGLNAATCEVRSDGVGPGGFLLSRCCY